MPKKSIMVLCAEQGTTHTNDVLPHVNEVISFCTNDLFQNRSFGALFFLRGSLLDRIR
jgi:hypothetical protein